MTSEQLCDDARERTAEDGRGCKYSEGMILGAIPGATPDKWVARWRSRYPQLPLEVQYYDDDAASAGAAQLERLRTGTVDVGYLRLPEDAPEVDKSLYHRVLLYREDPVVCAAADHWIAAAETSVTAAEIADETRFDPADMLPESAAEGIHTPKAGVELAQAQRTALETAAAGAGIVVLPASVARMLARRDIVIRTVEDLPGYQTGLAWLVENDSDLIQEFIGVARGRKLGSGRSAVPRAATSTDQPRRTPSQGKPGSGKQGAAKQGAAQQGPAGKQRSGSGTGRGPRSAAPGRASRPGAGKSGPRTRRGRR